MLMQCANVLGIEAVEMADGLSAPARLGISQVLLPGEFLWLGIPHYI
jgi:hypothetical protein